MSSISFGRAVHEVVFIEDALSPEISNRIANIYADDIDDDVDSYETIRFVEDTNNIVQNNVLSEDLELLDREVEQVEALSNSFNYSNNFYVATSRVVYYTNFFSSLIHRADCASSTVGRVFHEYIAGNNSEDNIVLTSNINTRSTALAYNFSFIVRIAIRNAYNTLESLNHDDSITARNSIDRLSLRIDDSIRIRLRIRDAQVADVD